MFIKKKEDISTVKQDIRSLSLEEITALFAKLGEQPFRAKQTYEWLWKKGIRSFDEMTNLSKDLRNYLSKNYSFNSIKIDTLQKSSDGTIKIRFRLYDGHFIEGVLIPTPHRMTACVSSQVGCSLSCRFCATGTMGRKRNLYADEIFDQVVILNQQATENYKQHLSNIVFMGMGEPLLNYKNVLIAIEKITSPTALGMSPRRITVSTAGVAKMIKKMADDKVKFNLAVSLHAADDAKRNKIMPINEENNLKILIEALNYFFDKTKNHITFEYILFDRFNDSLGDAEKLMKICRQVPSKVNIIEYNPVERINFTKSKDEQIKKFMLYLESKRINAKLRKSRGKDIDAACGQLANKN